MYSHSEAEIIQLRTDPDSIVDYCRRWTPEEIEQLKYEYLSGKTITDIALIHCRTEAAILSRIKKEGLVVVNQHVPSWMH